MAYIFDFTQHNTTYDPSELIDTLKTDCKKFGFQLEECPESKKLHYQGRLSLRKKEKTPAIVANLFKGTCLEGSHFSITSKNAVDKGVYDYVTKNQSRVDGPWTDKTEPPKVLTRQLKEFMTFETYPWQKDLIKICTTYDPRTIHMIYDQVGNNGKSSISEYLEYKNYAYELPPYNSMEDIMNWVCGIQEDLKPPAYLVDMPRGMKKDKLGQFYSGLESLKNGVAYDKRYHPKKIRFDRPQIIVFSNMLPDFELLSKDRWKIYVINKEFKLLDHTEHLMKRPDTLIE